MFSVTYIFILEQHFATEKSEEKRCKSVPAVPASTPDDNPLLNNTIHPTASYDTIDSKTRPTSMARQDSLSGSITNRGTFPMYVYHVYVTIYRLYVLC